MFINKGSSSLAEGTHRTGRDLYEKQRLYSYGNERRFCIGLSVSLDSHYVSYYS